jgi:hypothetical protein
MMESISRGVHGRREEYDRYYDDDDDDDDLDALTTMAFENRYDAYDIIMAQSCSLVRRYDPNPCP